uniref:Uncharacterized protein n=1 Tax=Tetranychus urticae TaxID=32264 RepID=T1JZS7_TETUR
MNLYELALSHCKQIIDRPKDSFATGMNKIPSLVEMSGEVWRLQRRVAAGSDTVSATLKWIMFGSEREPEYADRQQMPYTMACFYESLRLSSIVALTRTYE